MTVSHQLIAKQKMELAVVQVYNRLIKQREFEISMGTGFIEQESQAYVTVVLKVDIADLVTVRDRLDSIIQMYTLEENARQAIAACQPEEGERRGGLRP